MDLKKTLALSRRSLLKAAPIVALGITACEQPTSAEDLLTPLIDGPEFNRAPAAGLVVMRNNLVIAQAAVGQAVIDQRVFTTRSAFRAASISKLVVALTAEKLHNDGVVDLDKGIRTWLPFFPDNTVTGEMGPTLRALLSHTGGMKDPDVYWMAHPGHIETLLSYDAFRDTTDFEYCNLGYGLVATALEAATQRRFDRLSHDMALKPMGLDAGFNWAGVSADKKRLGATLYREFGTGWATQVDEQKTRESPDPLILMEEGADLRTYTPGTNGTLFSPQGGLRANLIDLATLAGRLKYAPELTTPVWRLNQAESNGLHDERYFTQFGTGVHIHPATESPWRGETLMGHHGEAYGLYAGAWYVPGLNVSFSYAVTGTPETPPARSQKHPALNTFTEVLMDAVIAAYAASPASK